MNEPIHVSDAAYENVVLKSELPVVVDFWAPWCGPCKMVLPLMDTVAKEYEGKLIVAKINIDENTQVASSYDVQSIPTLLFMKGGEVKDRHVGSLNIAQLKEKIDALLG